MLHQNMETQAINYTHFLIFCYVLLKKLYLFMFIYTFSTHTNPRVAQFIGVG